MPVDYWHGFFIHLFVLYRLMTRELRKKFYTPANLLLMLLMFSACQEKFTKETPAKPAPLFTLLAPAETGIDFRNTLEEGLNTNVMMYEYFYNGGGVAIGDVNADGLQDIYFTANMASNKLYLNKGDMQFEDVTDKASVSGRNGPWKTGVTMVDINGDRLLDIYVCYSGSVPAEKRANQLFINQGPDESGVPRFVEEAAQYGLASTSTSTQAVFFDYDRDRDLDMFLLNHNPRSIPVLSKAAAARMLATPDRQHGVRFFQNDHGHFEDITESAGISSSALTYGLGAGIADINRDGWMDIYICNDYEVPDYLYVNNGDGTFTDHLKSSLGHTSHFSMGNDIADINNDGLPDIYTLDMLPEDNNRQKLLLAPDNYGKFRLMLEKGFHYQYMRNMLQVNNGNGTFSEVGQVAGISNTDWSWAALLADYDNDGFKDLFVTNGYLRDYTNMDFIKYMEDFVNQKNGDLMRRDVLKLIYRMPASDVENYIYKNNGNLTFRDMRSAWGIDFPSSSNGAAYADLDNDGDLDLVVNNINKSAFVFQNQSEKVPDRHYLRIKTEGTGMNTLGLGAKVIIYDNGKIQYLEQMPTRGYQSSVSPVLHVGLGPEEHVDSLCVIWQSGKKQVIADIPADQTLLLKEEEAALDLVLPPPPPAPAFQSLVSPLAFQHKDRAVNDFKRQPLLISPLSFFGPCLVKGDVNGDGLEDVYAGGGSGQAGRLYLQQKSGGFLPAEIPAFTADKNSEDVDAAFLDANQDGFTDLYVCSGGYDLYTPGDPLLQDRLYLNDGQGNFTRAGSALPEMHVSKSCVRVADVNNDGYPDLFVGGRVIPGRYPETPRSYLLINDGMGKFVDMTATLAPGLLRVGMVSDAAWVDLNNDQVEELLVTGTWMPLMVFELDQGKYADNSGEYFEKEYRGWWNRIVVADFNGDGRPDLVAGNMGLNSQCKAGDQEPAEMYYKDFDYNGSVDPILCFYIQGKSYPYVTRDELKGQMSMMGARFTDYKSYADATLTDIFTPRELEGAGYLRANYLKTAYFESSASGKFREKPLPLEAQFSPVFSILPVDYNRDGHQDLILAGNAQHARLRFGKSDANYGLLLKGNGKGEFKTVPQPESGFRVSGDVRSMLRIGDLLLFGINQQEIQAYKNNYPAGPIKLSMRGE